MAGNHAAPKPNIKAWASAHVKSQVGLEERSEEKALARKDNRGVSKMRERERERESMNMEQERCL